MTPANTFAEDLRLFFGGEFEGDSLERILHYHKRILSSLGHLRHVGAEEIESYKDEYYGLVAPMTIRYEVEIVRAVLYKREHPSLSYRQCIEAVRRRSRHSTHAPIWTAGYKRRR